MVVGVKTRSTLPRDSEAALALIVRYLAPLDGVRRIWLFGSLAKGRLQDWRSDIDIAVEGLDGAALGRVWSELDSAIARPLDLIRYEDASEPLRSEIEKWGKLLYVAPQGAAACLQAVIAHRLAPSHDF